MNLSQMSKNMRFLILSLVVTVIAVLWFVGVATNLFADPAFSAFWWLSKTDAVAALFFVPCVVAPAIMLAEYYWLSERKAKF